MSRPRCAAPHSLRALFDGDLQVPPALERPVAGLAADSRRVEAGSVFFALRGLRHDGERFIDDAVAAGAVALVRAGGPARARLGPDGVVELWVPDPVVSLGRVADRFHGSPSHAIPVVGVTGTNGKTSVTHFVARALESGPAADAGRCGIIGTLGHGRPEALTSTNMTTPDALCVHRLLADLRSQGCDAVTMEVSSHALDQGRVAGVQFHTAVFTNLTRDHLDYHGEMSAYGAAKARLFLHPDLQVAVLNRDDPFCAEIAAGLARSVRVIRYGLGEAGADAGEFVGGRIASLDPAGMRLTFTGPQGGELTVPLAGRFNGPNLLAAAATLLGLGVPWPEAVARLTAVRAVPGRMEPFGGSGGRPLVVVDYAHTPDALAKALETLREQCRGRLCCVFGCGGERDPGKRALMGARAAACADRLILTDDNPRGEDGGEIVAQILEGVPAACPVTVERDRREAIRIAVESCGADDLVLVAGKGHETWQEAAGVRRPLSDAAVVRALLEEVAA